MLKFIKNKVKIYLYDSQNKFLRALIKLRFSTGKTKMIFIGNQYSGYWFPKTLLASKGTVYGAGLGADSSFEFKLVENGYYFFGFEPENSAYIISKSNFSGTNSRIFNYGLSNVSGNFISRGDNFSIADTYNYKHVNKQIFCIKSLWGVASDLKLLNSKKPRVLKMNIEGAEKGILQKLVSDPLPFDIIIFQAEFLFHLRFFEFKKRFYAFRELWVILKEFQQLNWSTIHVSKNQITISNLKFDQA
jgi:hypothetical protein